MTLAVVLLAAGHGSRMQSKKQKVLHDVGGKPMIQHVFESAAAVADLKPVIVVGPGEEGARRLLGDAANYVVQDERLGTGHATLVARGLLRGRADQVLVAYGDMPLLRAETWRRLAATQAEEGATIAMLTVMGDTDSTFGRVIRDGSGQVAEIVEVAEAQLRDDTEAILATRELNVGVYCFDAPWLWEQLPNLPLREAREGHEYYVTDMVGIAVAQGCAVEAVVLEDADEGLSAGTREELAAVEKAFRRRAAQKWLASGVTLVDPDATYIDPDVSIGQDTIIWPNTYVQGAATVGEGCVLGPNSIIRDAEIGDGCHVPQAVVENVSLAPGTEVAPFTHLQK